MNFRYIDHVFATYTSRLTFILVVIFGILDLPIEHGALHTSLLAQVVVVLRYMCDTLQELCRGSSTNLLLSMYPILVSMTSRKLSYD